MKLSILTSVSALALFAAAPAFAQSNQSNVNQVGSRGTATVSQNGLISTSNIYQAGDLKVIGTF